MLFVYCHRPEPVKAVCCCRAAGAGLAALLGVGVFGMGPGYLPEEDRAGYTSLAGGVGDSSGLAGQLSPTTAAAPAGTL